MKIAIISMIRDNWGGSEELWYDMAKAALSNGDSVSHLSYQTEEIHPKMQELIDLGLVSLTRPSYRPAATGRIGNLMRLASTFVRKKLNRSLRQIFREEPDVVIYNGTCYSISEETSLARLLEKSQARFYIIGHFNSEKDSVLTEEGKESIKKMYALAENVFFIAERSRRNAEMQLGADFPNGKLIRNPVNLSDISIIPYPKKTTLQIAMVGNLLMAHKGQDIALKLIGKEEWHHRDFHLNIYGSGPDMHLLKEMAVKEGIMNSVTFHGKVNDIRKVWENNHLLLMPSRMEGMPLAVVEAMLCGRPAVVTNVGGMTEWIEEGKSGFIADQADINHLSIAMEKAWRYRDNWEEMGKQAHKKAMELYDPNPGKTLLQLIQDKG